MAKVKRIVVKGSSLPVERFTPQDDRWIKVWLLLLTCAILGGFLTLLVAVYGYGWKPW